MAKVENTGLSSISGELVPKELASRAQERQTDPPIGRKKRNTKCKESLSYKESDEVRAHRIAEALVEAAAMSGENCIYANAAILEIEGVRFRGRKPVIDLDALVLEGLSVKETIKRILGAYKRAFSRKA